MITIQEILMLKDEAISMKPLAGPEWPDSVYYRYLGLLAKKMDAKLFVESGTCGGGCARTVALMSPSTKVVTIDIVKLPQVALAEKQCSNLEFILSDTVKVAKAWDYGLIDILFLDTTHLYIDTMNEFNAWRPHVRSGGAICFDDLNRAAFDGGVTKFYSELNGNKTEFNALHALHTSGPGDGGFGVLLVE